MNRTAVRCAPLALFLVLGAAGAGAATRAGDAGPGPAATAATTGVPAYRDAPTDAPEGEASPTPAPTDDLLGIKAIAPADAKNVARAHEWFARLQNGEIDRTQLTPAFAATFTEAIAQQTSDRYRAYGTPAVFAAGGKYVRDGVSAYVFVVRWPEGGVLFQFAVDDATGKIAGLFTRPAPPPSFTK